jgi:hypothetical protein
MASTDPTRHDHQTGRELEPYRPPAEQKPTTVLILDSLGRMHPPVALTLIGAGVAIAGGLVVSVVALAAAVMTFALALVGTVALGAVALAVVTLALRRS